MTELETLQAELIKAMQGKIDLLTNRITRLESRLSVEDFMQPTGPELAIRAGMDTNEALMQNFGVSIKGGRS